MTPNYLEQVCVSEIILRKEVESHHFPLLALRSHLHQLGEKIQEQVKDCQQNGRQILHIGLGLAPIEIGYDEEKAEPVFDEERSKLSAVIIRSGPSGVVPENFYEIPKFPQGWTGVNP